MKPDLFEKCRQPQIYNHLQEAGLYPYFIPIESSEGTEVELDGRRALMFGSNNYLGLTHDPRVMEAARAAISEYGTGCTGSRFLNGTLRLHLDLEERLARIMHKEAALVFSTGYQTTLGVITALVRRDELILCDRENHASILDGCRLSFGEVRKYPHCDMDALRRHLEATEDRARLIVTDGLFSMMGDLAPMPQLVDLAHEHGARLLVDDAHGFGVLGPHGTGTSDHFGLNGDVDLVMATFSKSMAGIGGFVAGPREVIEFIQHNARTMIFSASVPPPVCAASLACLDIIEQEPERRTRVMELASRGRAGLQDLGFDTGPSESPVVPVILGNRERTFVFWKMLVEEGVFVNPVTTPGVPPGMDLLRCSFMATHTEEQVDRFLAAFARVRDRMPAAATRLRAAES